MEKLKYKYEIFKKAAKTLEHQVNELFNTQKKWDEWQKITYEDSVIKRFEYSYEMTWKYLKEYLESKHGIKVASPKTVFQESMKQNIFDEEKTNTLLSMVEDRNNTSHGYDEAIAKDIINRVPKYVSIMKFILQNVTP